MKKSTLFGGAIILAAVAGALATGYLYLLKREKELDRYEQLLFSEDFSENTEDCCECGGECDCCEDANENQLDF